MGKVAAQGAQLWQRLGKVVALGAHILLSCHILSPTGGLEAPAAMLIKSRCQMQDAADRDSAKVAWCCKSNRMTFEVTVLRGIIN